MFGDLFGKKLRAAASALLISACLTGCGGFPATIPIFGPVAPVSPSPPTVNTAITAKNLLSIDLANQSVDVYTANLNGTASPVSSFAGGALSVTEDLAGNVYTANYSPTQASIAVYAPGATTPSRNISVATAASNAPQITTIAVDAAGYLYVAISNSILVYGPTSSSSAAPVRTLAGTHTLLSLAVTEMAFDPGGNLYVAQGSGYKGSQVIEFAAGASGDAAPTVITSADYFPSGVTLDAAGNIYIVQGSSPSAYNGTYTPAINVFPKGSVAGASPSRTISGNTGIAVYTGQIFVDSAGNIFVSAVLNGQTDFLVFSATATGNAAPASQLIRSRGGTTDNQFFLR